MDYVGRFEALRESIDHITSAVGGTHEAGALGHHNRSVRGPYREFYDEESSRWIGEIYARDCELFGYSFEETRRTLATRAGG
jgi:hypothetical protein